MNNENEPEIDVPEENEAAGLPLAIMKDGTQIMDKAATPQQMRVMEVNEALAPAYAKASTLNLTEIEIASIIEPFPDNMVEIRPHDGLIYIPHIHISDRLNGVLKPGQWSLVCRRHWMEGGTMYGEYILLIRGCYVGESVGGHPYQPNNPKTNYSDSLESTAAEALRRICGKRLSCGSQVWDPEYARNWVEKYAYQQNGKWHKRKGAEPSKPRAEEPISPKVVPTSTAQPPAHIPASPEKCLKKFIANIEEADLREKATQFLIDLAWMLPTEGLEKLEHRYVPRTKEQYIAFVTELTKWAATGNPVKPYLPIHDKEPGEKTAHPVPVEVPRDPNPDHASPDAPWRSFPMTHGKHAGTPLCELDKAYLYGLWANFTVDTSYVSKKDGKTYPVKPEQIAKAKKLRAMLNEAGAYYDFVKKD